MIYRQSPNIDFSIALNSKRKTRIQRVHPLGLDIRSILMYGAEFKIIVYMYISVVIGVIGALIGEFLFGLLGLSATSSIGSLITAVVEAIVPLSIVGWIKKK